MSIQDIERFICDTIENSGEDPCDWDVASMAEQLHAEGVNPDEMEHDEYWGMLATFEIIRF